METLFASRIRTGSCVATDPCRSWSPNSKQFRTTTFASEGSINRYYDPSTGQFISVDPLVAVTGQPFAYANDDPVNTTDPTGEGFWSSVGITTGCVLMGINCGTVIANDASAILHKGAVEVQEVATATAEELKKFDEGLRNKEDEIAEEIEKEAEKLGDETEKFAEQDINFYSNVGQNLQPVHPIPLCPLFPIPVPVP